MATIEKYIIAQANGSELDYEYDDYQEALGAARDKADQTNKKWQVIARQYEYTDSELIETVEPYT